MGAASCPASFIYRVLISTCICDEKVSVDQLQPCRLVPRRGEESAHSPNFVPFNASYPLVPRLLRRGWFHFVESTCPSQFFLWSMRPFFPRSRVVATSHCLGRPSSPVPPTFRLLFLAPPPIPLPILSYVATFVRVLLRLAPLVLLFFPFFFFQS